MSACVPFLGSQWLSWYVVVQVVNNAPQHRKLKGIRQLLDTRGRLNIIILLQYNNYNKYCKRLIWHNDSKFTVRIASTFNFLNTPLSHKKQLNNYKYNILKHNIFIMIIENRTVANPE